MTASKGTIYYLGLNQKNPNLAKPQVRQAMKYLVDYATIADTIMKGKVKVHQTFLPEGFLGALDGQSLQARRGKGQGAAEGGGSARWFHGDDGHPQHATTSPAIAQAIQQTMAQAGIKLEIIPGDGQQTLTKYRARNHDIYIGRWGPDYQDPNTNARDLRLATRTTLTTRRSKPLAWRNAWDIPELTQADRCCRAGAGSGDKRAEMYQDLQKKVQENSPFVIMFQEIEVYGPARRTSRASSSGRRSTTIDYARMTKN